MTGFCGCRAGSLQRVRSFRSTSASAAGGPLGVRKLSRSFDRKRVETIARVSLTFLLIHCLCCVQVTMNLVDQSSSDGSVCRHNDCLPPDKLCLLCWQQATGSWPVARWCTKSAVSRSVSLITSVVASSDTWQPTPGVISDRRLSTTACPTTACPAARLSFLQLSSQEGDDAAAGLAEQLAAADLRRGSLEKRNTLLEGFIGLTPPPLQVRDDQATGHRST
jgi:hypothetical protein